MSVDLPPLVTVDQVSARLASTYEGAELTQVERLCDDVSALIRARLPLVDQWLASDELSQDAVTAVGSQVVARALTSITTGGVGIRSEQHPEYSYELTSSTAAGLNLTNREVATLTPISARKRPFTIQPEGSN